MPRNPKEPNDRLAGLLAEIGLSNKGLARRIVERGAAVGLILSYDHNSVRRWLNGEQPQQPGPTLVAAVLQERLARRITPEDCGMHGQIDTAELGVEFNPDWTRGVHTVTALWRNDVERRRFLAGLAYGMAVYPSAAMRWLTHPVADAVTSAGARRVGPHDVAALRSMTSAFRDLDNRVGGGRVRATVVQYLHTEVAPMLRGAYNHTIGQDLFAAAADVTKLAGWMAYDEENHGLAQRYLVQSLRMARTAGDHALGAEILAAMSHQAAYVGRPSDAIDLARAAQHGARRAGIAALESECHIVEAHGHAAANDPSACAGALRAAEHAFARVTDAPPWLAYFDEAYLSAKIAHCFRDLGDHRRTAQHAERSLNMTDGYTRGRVFNLCLLATARVHDDPREAARVGGQALDIAIGLSSQRSRSYLRDVAHRLNPHTDMPEVAAFRHRVAALTIAA